MLRRTLLARLSAAAILAGAVLAAPAPVLADRSGLNAEANAALERLKSSQPAAAELLKHAHGVLVFPEIIKAGLVVGGSSGDGVLKVGGKTSGYYNSSAASFGLQAGITKFGYIMIFMDAASLDYVKSTDGWEVGVGPVVTVADEGFAKKLTTTSTHEGIYVFFIDQQGFFAGAGLEGTKITKLD